MDDGLQNASLAKDLAIAMVDGGRGLGNRPGHPGGPAARTSRVPARAGGCDRRQRSRPPAIGVAEWLRHQFDGPVLRSSTAPAGDASLAAGPACRRLGRHRLAAAFFRDARSARRRACRARHLSRPPAPHGKPMPSVSWRSRSGTRHASSAPKRTWRASKARPGNWQTLAAATRVLQIKLSFAEPDASGSPR